MKLIRGLWQRTVPESFRDRLYTFRKHTLRRTFRSRLGILSRILPFRLRCNICGGRAANFRSIWRAEPSLKNELITYGVSESRLEEFETLNARDYECPWCHANDRDRLFGLFIDRERSTRCNSSLRLLDFAPSAALQRFIQQRHEFVYRSADLFRSDVDDQVDVQDMASYAAGDFDAVICSHVLEHVPDDRQALREIYRVLAPGGWAIIMVPIPTTQEFTDEDPTVTDKAERVRRFDQPDHVRRYCRSDFVARLKATGGTVEQLTVQDFSETAFQSAGIMDRAVLYVLRRQICESPEPEVEEVCPG